MIQDKIIIQLLKDYETIITEEIEFFDINEEWEESLEDLQNTKWKINDSIRYLEDSIKFCDNAMKDFGKHSAEKEVSS